jgi:putative transposase
MRIAGQKSEAAWRELLQSLVERHLGTPSLAVIDGNRGLLAALRAQWPEIAIQRCTNQKLRNLLAKAPAHMREELAADYRRMVYADSSEVVGQERARFLRKWRLRCKAVIIFKPPSPMSGLR